VEFHLFSKNLPGFLRESGEFHSVCCCSWRSNISETSSDSAGIVIWLSVYLTVLLSGACNYYEPSNLSVVRVVIFSCSVFKVCMDAWCLVAKLFCQYWSGKNLQFVLFYFDSTYFFYPFKLMNLIIFPSNLIIITYLSLFETYLIRKKN
jgi:hypothetical protein